MDLSGMEALFTAAQSRALDRCAIDRHGIAGFRLMARAARASFAALMARWPEPASVQVLCGTGNNGGDGFLIAELARARGIEVLVQQLGDADKIGGDALLARRHALAAGVVMRPFEAAALGGAGVVVDAMLGTGLGGDVRGAYRDAIAAVNACAAPVLAVDVPSGLCSDTGRVLGEAVRADLTVSFIGLKRGLFTLAAPDHCGEVQFAALEVPQAVYSEVPPDCYRLDLERLLEQQPARPASAHKGLYGTVLVVGGDHGMAGAAAMAGEAALRTGAGLVRIATRPGHVAAIVSRAPELMAFGVDSGQELAPLIAGADVLVVGPGLGQSAWSEQLFQAALASAGPMLLDADGLNLLSRKGAAGIDLAEKCVLTPHPGEAARLLGMTTAGVQADRFAAARSLVQRFGAVAVLKGNGSLIGGGDRLLLSDYGNPGMASGGMGDVLSGVIGSFMAQGLEPLEAAALGVCLHGAAADLAAEDGQRGLAATDLLAPMRALLR